MQSAVREQVRAHTRWAIRRDMAEILEIERHSYDAPWAEEDFLRCLRQRNCIGMVAEVGEKVVGYMLYELEKKRLHLINFAVHPGFRRRGVGGMMVDKLKGKLSGHRRQALTMEVRETNLPAQLFLRSQGFRARKVTRRSFQDTGEDGYWMVYVLPPESGGGRRPCQGVGW